MVVENVVLMTNDSWTMATISHQFNLSICLYLQAIADGEWKVKGVTRSRWIDDMMEVRNLLRHKFRFAREVWEEWRRKDGRARYIDVVRKEERQGVGWERERGRQEVNKERVLL